MYPLEAFKDPTSLKDKVYDTLKTEIILGRFKAGERLNILELASAMNISSAPIREALNMLNQDGFVVLTPRKKAIVSEVSLQDYNVVMELRLMLEPYAAKNSKGKIPQKNIDDVRKQLGAVCKNPEDKYLYIASDIALHKLLHLYSGSALLSDILSTTKEHSLRLRYCVEELADENKKADFVIATTNEHLQILDWIETGTPDQIYQCVKQHLGNYIFDPQENEGILNSFLKN